MPFFDIIFVWPSRLNSFYCHLPIKQTNKFPKSRRSSIPIVTAVVSAILEGRKPHADEFGALVLLSVGVSLAIAEASAAGNALGVTLCVISVLSGATQLNASGRVLSEKMDSVQLAFFSAPVTSLCLFPVFFVREYSDFVEYFARDHYLSLAIILVGSVIAAAYNVVHYALVAITDPVSTCVLGQIKVIAIMVLSAACLGEGRDFTPPMIAGCICAVLGFSFYSWARVQRQTLAGLIAAGLKTPGGSTPKETPKRNLIKAVRSFQGSPMPTPYALRSASVLRSRMTVSKVELALSPPRVGYAS